MKLKITLVAFLLCFIGTMSAQVDQTQTVQDVLQVDVTDSTVSNGWRHGGVTNLNFSQLYLSNWAAGGQNSYSLNGLVSLFLSYKKNSLVWDNTLDVGYGFLNQKDDPIKDFRKTDDRFEFNSKVGYKAFGDFYYAGMLSFKTQFDKGYKYELDANGEIPLISDLLSPAYLTGALGLSYQPNNYFSLFVAPVTERMTIVRNEALRANYSVDIDKMTRLEFGGYVRAVFSKNDFKAPFLKNITLTSKLDLFSNYLHNPENVDVNWEVLIAMKVNKYLSVNINTQLIYDDDIVIKGNTGPRIQFKELLGVGFSYNF